jgi:hypothetical protein
MHRLPKLVQNAHAQRVAPAAYELHDDQLGGNLEVHDETDPRAFTLNFR